MKRIKVTLLLALGFGYLTCVAQPSLTYSKHALKAGADNPMSYCSYMEPGLSGANLMWDFTQLEFEKSFTGYLSQSSNADKSMNYLQANTVLEEFNTQFFFNVGENIIELYGYASKNGNSVTRYETPFVKMKYPFGFNDQFTGSFSGENLSNGKVYSTVSGTYEVVADAYGTLLLPGGVSYNNTLRVKSTKSYTNSGSSYSNDIETVTYRWYNGAHRYPLLVLTEIKVKSGNNVHISHQSAYNNNAFLDVAPAISESIELYPNPASTSMSFKYNAIAPGTLYFTIIDNAGKPIHSFEQEVTASGNHSIDISEHVADLKSGTYLLQVQNGNEMVQRNFIKFD